MVATLSLITLINAPFLLSTREPVYSWGHKRLPKQSGITTYTLSPNQSRPMAHAFHRAIFNTFRRCKAQFLYVVPPFVVAYFLMQWANEKSVTSLLLNLSVLGPRTYQHLQRLCRRLSCTGPPNTEWSGQERQRLQGWDVSALPAPIFELPKPERTFTSHQVMFSQCKMLTVPLRRIL